MSVFAKRVKAARLQAGLSQERLGVEAGIDELSSSARMNQYERGKHEPDFSMVERIAGVLNVPECYFYCKDDDVAQILVQLHRAPEARKAEAIATIQNLFL
jgi:transcriptional regulator with XRE-family HTH domain